MLESINQALVEVRNPNHEIRIAAIRYIRSQRSKQALRDLVLAMEDPHPSTRMTVAIEIGRKGIAEGQQPLIDHLLKDPSKDVRWMCASTLYYYFKSDQSMPALIQALSDSSDRVVSAACAALGEYNHPDAIAALKGMLTYPDWIARLHVCASLIALKSVDEDVLGCLEQLNSSPKAMEHNAEARKVNAINRELEGPNAELVMDVTDDLLEAARLLGRAQCNLEERVGI